MELYANVSGLEKSYFDLDYLWKTYGNKRTTQFPLFGSPWPLVGILLGFWGLIKWTGAKKCAFDVKPFMLVYNGLMFGACGAGIPMALVLTNSGLDSFNCNALDPNSGQFKVIGVQCLGYILLVMKLLDFGVAFFMAIRGGKKNPTNGYLFYLISTAIFVYLGLLFYPGGVFMFFPVLDIFFHFMSYGYFALSVAGFNGKDQTAFRSLLTYCRLFTFVAAIVHGLAFLDVPDCGPNWFKWTQIVYASVALLIYFVSDKPQINIS